MDKSKLAVKTYNKIAKIYSDNFFTDLSDTPYIDIFLSKLPAGSTILEVGSGPGQFVKYLIEKDYKAQGIDASEKMIELSRKKVPEGKFEVMDMRNMKFEDEIFDGLISPYSLIHIPSKEITDTLKGFFRVIKPKGYLMVIAQKGESDKTIEESFMPSEKMFFNFFTKGKLKNFIINAGFTMEYLQEVENQVPNTMSDTIIYAIASKN